MDLFSSFDPDVFNSHVPANWVCLGFFLLVVPTSWASSKGSVATLFSTICNYVKNELSGNLRPDSSPMGSLWPLITYFVVVSLINVSGLTPYIFPGTSHLVFTISVSLPLWIGYMAHSWLTQTQSMLAHLVPLSTPPLLLPFMVLVELVSSMIRPLTLAVRLAANIVAGHLILVLVSSVITVKSSFFALILASFSSVIVALCVLESGVSLIQAYVFVALQSLYLGEVSSGVKVK